MGLYTAFLKANLGTASGIKGSLDGPNVFFAKYIILRRKNH